MGGKGVAVSRSMISSGRMLPWVGSRPIRLPRCTMLKPCGCLMSTKRPTQSWLPLSSSTRMYNSPGQMLLIRMECTAVSFCSTSSTKSQKAWCLGPTIVSEETDSWPPPCPWPPCPRYCAIAGSDNKRNKYRIVFFMVRLF